MVWGDVVSRKPPARTHNLMPKPFQQRVLAQYPPAWTRHLQMAFNVSKSVDADHAPSYYHAIGSINLSLTNDHLQGNQKQFHIARVREVSKAAMSNASVLGIAFCGVGSVSHGLDEACQRVFASAIRDGFRAAGVQGQPVVRYEALCATAIALRSHVQVIKHGVLHDLAGPNKGRAAQWVDVVCEDGGEARLINTSQSALGDTP